MRTERGAMSKRAAAYLLETIQAPPTMASTADALLVDVHPPEGYQLHSWRAFSTDGQDPWGYALLLWERRK